MEAVDDLARAGRSAHALHGRGHGVDDAFRAGPEECELVGPLDGAQLLEQRGAVDERGRREHGLERPGRGLAAGTRARPRPPRAAGRARPRGRRRLRWNASRSRRRGARCRSTTARARGASDPARCRRGTPDPAGRAGSRAAGDSARRRSRRSARRTCCSRRAGSGRCDATSPARGRRRPPPSARRAWRRRTAALPLRHSSAAELRTPRKPVFRVRPGPRCVPNTAAGDSLSADCHEIVIGSTG